MFTPELKHYDAIKEKATEISALPLTDLVFPHLQMKTRYHISTRTAYGYVSMYLGISPLLGAPSFPRWVDREELIVGYYYDQRSLEAGRLTETRMGRYLQSLGLSDSFVVSEVNRVKSIYAKVEIDFAITANEIADVYRYGPNSCMSEDKGIYNLRDATLGYYAFSVPSLYAYPYDRTEIVPGSGNSLAVAYVRSERSPLHYKSRALVCMERKVFPRIYGDIAPMLAGLTRLGYTQQKDMIMGVPLSVKKCSDGRYLCPYIDIKYHHAVGVKVEDDMMYVDRYGLWDFGTSKILTRREGF